MITDWHFSYGNEKIIENAKAVQLQNNYVSYRYRNIYCMI